MTVEPNETCHLDMYAYQGSALADQITETLEVAPPRISSVTRNTAHRASRNLVATGPLVYVGRGSAITNCMVRGQSAVMGSYDVMAIRDHRATLLWLYYRTI
ncbi:uncharacterized protein H6S33_012435 [Morchella sextelata]|uniref:uncharacterized protein n=1 Tax=Morchella sextelata TaxID=1174677 RepID=UPI001D050062|nr:uncharacterized protein H6S33_012435 [Morchella sextelata]KAH0609889.1 hypothetical protein H6S33_012435 [Morchella sextelata]